MKTEKLVPTDTNLHPIPNGAPDCSDSKTQSESDSESESAAVPLKRDEGGATAPSEGELPDHLLLDELVSVLNRFLVLPKWAAEAIALWVLHTYAFELRDVTTYLGIESPEKRCGKTTLLGVLGKLVHRPIAAANISSPAFFRVIEEMCPTLLIDEADTFLHGNDELRGILNAGYRRDTAFVMRVANQIPASPVERAKRASLPANSTQPAMFPGEGWTPQSEPATCNLQPATLNSPTAPGRGLRLVTFSCWCPKVLAKIGRLPDTLADRCIVVRMHRKTALEERERSRDFDASELRRHCLRFVAEHGAAIASARPALPPALNDRAADIWEPLLVLADLAGGDWPQKARSAAAALTAAAQETNPIASLLTDICVAFAFAGTDRFFTRTLLDGLNEFPDRPWAELRKGKEITPLWLAAQLAPYGIRPRTLWCDGASAKGYLKEDFTEIFRRYIPRSEFDAIKEQYQSPEPQPDPSPTAEASPGSSQNKA